MKEPPRPPTPMTKTARPAPTAAPVDTAAQESSYLFKVYLRLRPPSFSSPRFLITHPAQPSQVYVQPPPAPRSSSAPSVRAIEKFSFTEIFAENSTQRDVFEKAAMPMLVDLVRNGRDGLLATLGVTGSGKTHTILGTKGTKGIMQMTLEVLMASVGARVVDFAKLNLTAIDHSDAVIMNASQFLNTTKEGVETYLKKTNQSSTALNSKLPDISDINIPSDKRMSYAIMLSMYEVYNDRIFDLLDERTLSPTFSGMKRKAVHFKKLGSWDNKADREKERKTVFGLRKVYVRTLEEALKVLDYGQTCRHASPTSANEASSRSHAFFAIEVKRFAARSGTLLQSGTFQIVDLAGSERSRLANTQGERLAEAGSINRSLMYLGQCMQLQTQIENGKPAVVVPFRQSKLTDLLFSNSFQGAASQRAAIIATADPQGDYNSTTQILRYTALAREVTVPRAPPVRIPEAIVAMEEDTSVNPELVKQLLAQLEASQARCKIAEDGWKEAEQRLQDMEERSLFLEQQIREEISNEFEERARELKGVYLDKLLDDEQAGRNFVDNKLEIAMRGMDIEVYEDDRGILDEEVKQRMAQLERENEELRMEVLRLRREGGAKSPVKGKRVRSVTKKKVVLMVPAKKVNHHMIEDVENVSPAEQSAGELAT